MKITKISGNYATILERKDLANEIPRASNEDEMADEDSNRE